MYHLARTTETVYIDLTSESCLKTHRFLTETMAGQALRLPGYVKLVVAKLFKWFKLKMNTNKSV